MRFRSALVLVSLPALSLALSGASAQAQSSKQSQLTAPQLPSPGTPAAPNVDVPKSTTPPQPGSAQPVLPGAARSGPPTSPVVEEIVREKSPLLVRKRPRSRWVVVRPRHYAGHRHRYYSDRVLDRPALAGVDLVAPLPPPPEGPHVIVPVPAYPVESVLARITTPPPPIRCHPTRRDPYEPDPHLYKEVPVQCEPDED